MGFNLGSLLGGGLGSAVKEVVGAFKIDPTKKAEFQAAIDAHDAEFKLAELQLQAKLQDAMSAEIQGQIDVNKIEAASPSLFVSGWRPGAGWVCVLGLCYSVLGQPLISWIAAMFGKPAAPTVDTSVLMTLLLGLLGLGAYRMNEKVKGVASV